MRQPKCVCGTCQFCRNLDATRRYKERHKERLAAKRDTPEWKAARRERDRRYRERHPDRLKASRDLYYRSHVAECKAALRRWRKENPEKYREQSRRFRAAHADELRIRNRAFMREFYKEHREEINARAKARRDAQIEHYRAKERRRSLARYGLTLESYAEMARRQDHKCAICRELVEGNLHVDHCHASGRVRGLLCGACNTSIGSFADDPARLRRAADYLEGKHPWA